MAGIGFALRKLARQDNLTGLAQAYTHSALASTGPWLFTIIALGIIMLISSAYISNDQLLNFRVIIIYNFSFSLVFSAPIFMVATRYLADRIYEKDVSSAPGMLLGSMILLYAFIFPAAVGFYVLFAKFDDELTYGAIINFMLISSIWLVSVFVSALKDYKAITKAFALGMVFAILISVYLARDYQVAGMLYGFSAGLSVILAVLIAKIFAEYPYPFKQPFAFIRYFKRYWELALGGLIYNAAVWVDKWMMWFAPESEKVANGLRVYSHYDSAMFLAYLTIVPAMAMFIFSIETNFFERYLRYYRDIQHQASYKKILQNHQSLISSIFGSASNFLVLQGSICVLTILMAPKIFDLLGVHYLQMGIFRYGVLGALFHVLTMFLLILLSYFDNRRATFLIQCLFLLANIFFTWASMRAGFEYYGYGYFLASLVVFVVAAVVTARYVMKLPYHTFITTNSSVRT